MSAAIIRVILALTLLADVSATQSGIAPWQHPEVVKVDCREGSGTAFSVGPTVMLSVAHVTSLHQCLINGRPFKVIGTHGDFSILQLPTAETRWLALDCGGFVAGHRYTAIGYAHGLDTQTTVDIEATGESIGGFARLTGVFNAIPGQSGGPVVDADTGKVVGTVNVYNAQAGDTGSTELRGTSVCRGGQA